ncbi:MAG: Asp-tRNA(Asn)/Glu-tRNA(Gln) amidotransferase subunit GatC [Clostridiales bacterium]|nr:Asp-tRNA(Asn)/Glu-tRNA(Gln) amidotransferase subunit GatC [Clostridiales bacterium]MCF8021670.1 Asp-tRNA(Asn)/Glu-tRNA(Gln) amidotransferase subunit GatC [Clostridiales bacterium]
MISKSDVEHVATLARLELSEEEKELYTKQLSAIMEYFEKLKELDTDDVPPTPHVLPLKNVLREDKPGEQMDSEKALSNAPDREGNYFRVPKIV